MTKRDRLPPLTPQDELDRLGRDPRYPPGSGFVIAFAGGLVLLACIGVFVAVVAG